MRAVLSGSLAVLISAPTWSEWQVGDVVYVHDIEAAKDFGNEIVIARVSCPTRVLRYGMLGQRLIHIDDAIDQNLYINADTMGYMLEYMEHEDEKTMRW